MEKVFALHVLQSNSISLLLQEGSGEISVTNENSMSKRFFKWLFPPPPARRIIMSRHGSVKRKGAAWVWIRSGDSPRVSLESTSLVRGH
ncbi:hypothetical protein Bca4012_042884 [Brassica carinata]